MPERDDELRADRLLEVLTRHRVRFVLIGGLAAIARGSPFPTEDVDITPDRDLANVDRLSAALTELGALIRTDAVPQGLPFSHDGESPAAAGVWNLVTEFGDLDICFVPDGTEGYPDLVRHATDERAWGLVITIASLEDIVRSKQAANRLKDQRVLPTLRRILAERHRHDS